MTVKKALKILDGYYEQKTILKIGLEDPTKDWNCGHDLATQVAEMFADHISTDLAILKAIKKQIQPNCKHPKKLHDKDSDGNLYCMGCNLDL